MQRNKLILRSVLCISKPPSKRFQTLATVCSRRSALEAARFRGKMYEKIKENKPLESLAVNIHERESDGEMPAQIMETL